MEDIEMVKVEPKKYVKVVNGKEYEINPKKYYENFKEKHNEQHKCEVCDGSYNYYSKKTHLKSKKHMIAQKLKVEIDGLLEQIKNK